MNFLKNMGWTVPATFVISSTSAFADVTPEDVWALWQDYLTSSGYEVSADTSTSGNVLTVDNLTLSMDQGEDMGSFSARMGTMTFSDNKDGTVKIGFAENMPLTMSMTDGEEPLDLSMVVSYIGLDMVASGEPTNQKYDFTADNMKLALTEVVADGEAVENASFNMDFAATTGSSTLAIAGGMIDTMQSMTSGAITFAGAISEPGEGSVNVSGNFADTALSTSASLPITEDPSSDPLAMFYGGMQGTTKFTSGVSTVSLSGQDNDGPFQMDVSAASNALEFDMDSDHIRYDTGAEGIAMTMFGGGIPFPLSFEMASTSTNFEMPLSRTETPAPFALGVTFADLSVPEMLWGMVDPTGQLPHDPATVSINIGGTATLFGDLLSEDVMESDDIPGEVNTVTVENLLLRIAGAELTGAGAATLDNTDLTTFDGMPRPEGSLSLKLVGGNKLLDTLVGMGLVPEDQAMGARMMMGLFAIPTGDDQLESTLEINAEGHILANGQRIQ